MIFDHFSFFFQLGGFCTQCAIIIIVVVVFFCQTITALCTIYHVRCGKFYFSYLYYRVSHTTTSKLHHLLYNGGVYWARKDYITYIVISYVTYRIFKVFYEYYKPYAKHIKILRAYLLIVIKYVAGTRRAY